ncbi:hypothetical protein DFH11DRAFT_1596981 [Phellopilus nigrolimitatus]|nr:hypothetical protein DFH11DRAFT_1596981 [Phellopilus nigrolimitatus]
MSGSLAFPRCTARLYPLPTFLHSILALKSQRSGSRLSYSATMEFSSKNKQSFQGFLSALTGFFSFTNLKAPHAELSLTDLKPVSILYPQQSLDSLLRALARAPAVDLVSNVKIGLQRIRLAFVVGALLAIELGLTLLVRYLYAFYIEKVI